MPLIGIHIIGTCSVCCVDKIINIDFVGDFLICCWYYCVRIGYVVICVVRVCLLYARARGDVACQIRGNIFPT